MPETPEYPPPPGLSPKSKALWAAVVPKRAVSAGRRALIEEALRARDRADQAAAIVDREGPCFVTKTTGTVHVRPEVKIERDCRALFASVWRGMHLEFAPEEDGRIVR